MFSGRSLQGLGWATTHPKKLKKINDHKSPLRDFMQFCVGFRFRIVQIPAKWCSCPPEKFK